MNKLYSIGCPKCNILEKKLQNAGIEFELITDDETIEKIGYEFFPVLEVDDQIMDFATAIEWLKN